MRNVFPGHRGARGLTVAVAGLFLGHVLIYRIVAPSVLQRAILLAGTGHAYLPLAASVAVGVGAAAAIGAFLLGLRRGVSRDPGEQPGRRFGLLQTLAVPAVAQAAAFLVLELLERALAGAPLGGLLGPLLPVGVLLQLAVGALGGLVLLGLDRAGERVGRSLTARRRAPRRGGGHPRFSVVTQNFPCLELAGATGIRGPPATA
jgi:hypothetical protein